MATQKEAELRKGRRAREEIPALRKELEWKTERIEELRKDRDANQSLSLERRDTIKALRSKLELARADLETSRIEQAFSDGYRSRVRDCDRQELLDRLIALGAKADDLWPIRESSNTVGGYAEGRPPRSFA